MRRTDHKSDCAINFALETVGDPWTLLIVRDIAFFQKSEFTEFVASDERIGTNTLSRRLRHLELQGVISKSTLASDRRRERYQLTEKGLDLIPILIQLTLWGASHDPATGASADEVAAMRADPDAFAARVRERILTSPSRD